MSSIVLNQGYYNNSLQVFTLHRRIMFLYNCMQYGEGWRDSPMLLFCLTHEVYFI